MPLAGSAEQVGAPNEHVYRMIARGIRVFTGKTEAAVLEAVHHVVLWLDAGGARFAHNLQRIAIQLRRARRPAHALGAHVAIDQTAVEPLRVGQWRKNLLNAQPFVAPLAAVEIEERGAGHLPGRTHPVARERKRHPTGLRAQLLLPHIVRPAAAGLTDTAA